MQNKIFLPDDVWLNIFDWASFVPNAFDTHAPDMFSYPGPCSQEQIQGGIRETLCTKRRIVLVCRTWNILATPFLYKAIPIVRKTTLEKILRTLSMTDENGVNTETWKGRWTMRLDIVLKYGGQLPADDFIALLRLLPDIRVIVARSEFFAFTQSNGPISLIDLLGVARQSTLLGSLHVLDIRSVRSADRIDALDAIDGLSLRIVRIYPPVLSLWLGKRITLPEIELLEAPPQLLNSVFSGEIPAGTLRHLSIKGDFDAVWKIIGGYLSGVGGQLLSLEIDDGCLDNSVNFRHISRPMPKAFFREVAHSCPNLDSLIINSKWRSLSYLGDGLPPVRRLGLRFHQKDADGKNWLKHLCSVLSICVSISDSLQVIRIIGRPSYAELQYHHSGSLKIMQNFSKAVLLGSRVRFEDRTGRLFHDVA
ncbi:hypothetical protein ACEPAI_5488 [Sanghuangporus weigelae]